IFGLTSQMRKSAISIPSNIAEGRGRGTRKDFSNFLKVSLGSSNELETQIEISKRLNYIKKCDYLDNLLVEIMKITNTMIGKLDYNYK
ncbi:MAG TPA: four helix bundle protein, partial [Patescibacteria group bacterium]|nr:four helix bundle protein [Patescibacteria group bacterium]